MSTSASAIGALEALLKWPGKSNDEGQRHPALWHLLDVAAAAEALLPLGPMSGLAPGHRSALIFLSALHDIGKFSLSFRAQIERGEPPGEGNRHWRLSAIQMQEHDAKLASHLSGSREVREILADAVAGHHGRPYHVDRHSYRRQKAAIGREGLDAGALAIDMLAPLFAPMHLDGIDEAEARRLSWLLQGHVVLADWIGSNAEWFPFPAPETDLAEYWSRAHAQAERAVEEAGLGGAQPDPACRAEDLAGGALRPMQRIAAFEPLAEGPGLMLIEDATGAGKTEAALLLAQRMILAGKARGLYFALPTMATAEAMFARMRPQLRRLFSGRPSLALLHGRRALSDGFAEVRGNWGAARSDAACAHWIADDRRLSLLAEIGVGTIDQALMAVLPTRFNALRLHALAGRLLIVDEAHAYDPYMEAELRRLLTFQARLGGSAIVMTATLPEAMRAGLVQAFREGLGAEGEAPLSDVYPAFTHVGPETRSLPVEPVPATCRRVTVERLADEPTAIQALVAAARKGAACVWIRNAVDPAIEAVSTLRAADVEADLFHARFALADRLQTERAVLAHYGKERAPRPGRVLVATQVVEASLDLDFDVMVSDLAPIGALMQRAGRLWRHMDRRPADERPIEGPTLQVLSPDPAQVADARWLYRTLGTGAHVYGAAEMWRTADALFRVGAIVSPDGLRELIEAVHGEGAKEVPEPLARAEIEALGQRFSDTGIAHQWLLDPGQGVSAQAASWDDRIFPTRLGQEQVTLVLAHPGPEGLHPWAEAETRLRAEALSEVQISRRRYETTGLRDLQGRAEVAAFTSGWKDWERAVKAVAPVAPGGAICPGVRYDPREGLVFETE